MTNITYIHIPAVIEKEIWPMSDNLKTQDDNIAHATIMKPILSNIQNSIKREDAEKAISIGRHMASECQHWPQILVNYTEPGPIISRYKAMYANFIIFNADQNGTERSILNSNYKDAYCIVKATLVHNQTVKRFRIGISEMHCMSDNYTDTKEITRISDNVLKYNDTVNFYLDNLPIEKQYEMDAIEMGLIDDLDNRVFFENKCFVNEYYKRLYNANIAWSSGPARIDSLENREAPRKGIPCKILLFNKSDDNIHCHTLTINMK